MDEVTKAAVVRALNAKRQGWDLSEDQERVGLYLIAREGSQAQQRLLCRKLRAAASDIAERRGTSVAEVLETWRELVGPWGLTVAPGEGVDDCPICKRSAVARPDPGGTHWRKCELCGEYWYTDEAGACVKARVAEDATNVAKTAAFIREQNLMGNVPSFLHRNGTAPHGISFEQALAAYPQSLPERHQRVLFNLYRIQGSYEGTAELVPRNDHPCCFASDASGMTRLIRDLEEEGLLKDAGSHQEAIRVRLASNVWSAIEDALQSEPKGPIGFRPSKQ